MSVFHNGTGRRLPEFPEAKGLHHSQWTWCTQLGLSFYISLSKRGKREKLYFSWNYRKFWLNWVTPLLILQLLETCKTTYFWSYIGLLNSCFVTSAWKRRGFLEQGGLEIRAELVQRVKAEAGWRGYPRAAIQPHAAQHKWTNTCRPAAPCKLWVWVLCASV